MSSPLHVLFVCSRNRWRSPTAERLYQHDARIEVRSAGVSASAVRTLRLEDLEWADLVLAMERRHAVRIREQFRDLSPLPPIEILDIPDEFAFMDDELVNLLRAHVEPILSAVLR